MATRLGPQQEFTEIAIRFFRLDLRKTEWDLFCTMNSLSHYPTEEYERQHRLRSFIGRFRDRLFSMVFLRPRVKPSCWHSRLSAWQRHLDSYFEIAGLTSPIGRPDATILQVERLKFLIELLRILDAKLAMLLTLNSVLVALLGVSIKETTDLLANAPTHSFVGLYEKTACAIAIEGSLIFLLACCFFNIWHALRGFRRVVWGDLTTGANFVDREIEYSNFLILSLARRTNMFRIVAEVTKVAFIIFFLFALIALGVFLHRSRSWFIMERSALVHSISAKPQPPAFNSNLVREGFVQKGIPSQGPQKKDKTGQSQHATRRHGDKNPARAEPSS